MVVVSDDRLAYSTHHIGLQLYSPCPLAFLSQYAHGSSLVTSGSTFPIDDGVTDYQFRDLIKTLKLLVIQCDDSKRLGDWARGGSRR